MVFGLAFAVIGFLIVRSVRVMAQDFTFRPRTGFPNTYAASVSSTQRLDFAFDSNTNTAATTYTNADFSGDGSTPDTDFSFSGKWSAFDQTTTFIRDIGLYVIRQGIDNSLNQWRIQYTLYGAGAADGDWFTIEDNTSVANPSKGEITTTVPDDTDLENDLAVRTATRQEDTDDAKLKIFDIRVEAEWDPTTGGANPLDIDTTTLPDGIKDVAYSETITASGGNTDYHWCLFSGTVPPGLSFSPALSSCPTTATSTPSITLSGTPTTGGEYTFTVKVSDDSSPAQTADEQYTITIAGLGIDPPGPTMTGWDPVIKGTAGSQTFTPQGGTSPYDWCLVSGSVPTGTSFAPSVPSCPSTVAGNTVTLSGTPNNAGVFSFKLKLADSGGETPTENTYVVEVSSTGVMIIPRLLKPMVKGISYGTADPGYTPMTAQQLWASNAVYSTVVSEITWSVFAGALPTVLSLQNTTFNAIANTTSVYIGGEIGIGVASATHNFTAKVDDDATDSDTEDFSLKVLPRNTLLLSTPSASVALPSDNRLDFLVFAEGGAPSKSDDSELDGTSVPYYNYAWDVTPVDDAPALTVLSGTTSTNKAGPDTVSITFTDAGDQPVTGTYDVTFRAQDHLRRQNPSDGSYAFTPANARINIISPAGGTLQKDTTRPTMLRQERFR